MELEFGKLVFWGGTILEDSEQQLRKHYKYYYVC